MSGNSPAHRAWIDRHYEANQPAFNRAWSRDYLRYGFWPPNTWFLRDALRNTDRFIAERLALSKSDDVLDAGCGVGGSAIHFAKACGCRVTGINLCGAQLAIARAKAHEAGVDEQVRFEERDHSASGLTGGSFTKILAVESVYHCEDPARFAAECFRLLRPGGTLLVTDRFLGRGQLTAKEQRDYEIFKRGQAVTRLPEAAGFGRCLRDAGFTPVEHVDQTALVLRGSRLCSLIAALGYPTVRLAVALRLQPPELARHSRSLLAIGRLFASGAVVYGSFIAAKPAL
jgi:SAM-dependent methyltransferase